MEPEVRYCTTSDGVNIAYDVTGRGPPIVWVSLIWTSHLSVSWRVPQIRSVIESLAADFTVVRYDGRGSGLSQREPFDFSLEARLRDLEAVIDRTQTGSFALLGGLGAGATAIAYAGRHPNRVSALLLNGAYADGARFLQESPAARFFVALQEVTQEQWDAVTLAISNLIVGAADPGSAARMAELSRASMKPDALLSLREATRRIDVTPLLKEVSAPTLVLHAESPLFSLAVSQELASGIANARLVVASDPPGQPPGNSARAAMRAFLGAAPEAPLEAPPAASGVAPGLVTILFTDVEGSTALTARLGDAAAREVLREHERITREALKANGGSEVKTMGDGLMASFGSATKALECAIGIQRAFAGERGVGARHPEGVSEPRLTASTESQDKSSRVSAASPLHSDLETQTAQPEPIRVRIGLNAGEPIAEDDDLFGTAVIVAARIAAQAHGGEILVSDVVRQLVAGKRFLFNDRGEHALKGFEDPVRVFEVLWRED